VNPNRQATPLTLPADEVTQGDTPLGLMQENLITFPFKPNAPWTTHQRRKKRNKNWKHNSINFALLIENKHNATHEIKTQ
jgi:hypothetical protein